MTLVELEQVQFGYGRRPLLPPIDLAIERGSFWGIVGPNGSGKTTLVRTLLGLLPPVRGAVRWPSGRRPRFGYVPQRAETEMAFPLTAFEVALMGRYGLCGPIHRPARADREQTERALAEAGAADLAARPFFALSGGQRQRVLVARALASEPDILVLDEPTAGMDIVAERALLDGVAQITSARGVAVIMVSHQLGAVSDYARDFVLLSGAQRPIHIGARAETLTAERLSAIYGHPIAVSRVDGHTVIFVEHECNPAVEATVRS